MHGDNQKGSYILVVGGAGYIGSHTCKSLYEQGVPFIVLDNLSTGHNAFVKWSPLINADLADKSAVEECFKTYPIHAVMHFSAFANVGESVKNPSKYYQNNVANTLNLLDVMVKYKVKRFIFSSTCATYGIPQTDTLSETHPQHPISPYGRSKLMVEHIAQDYAIAHGLTSIFLRYFNAGGASIDSEIGERHDPETHLIPLAISAGTTGLPLSVFGNDYPTPDGTCIRDYIHVTDLANAHIKALQHLEKTNKSDAFNLGTGRGHSVTQVITEIEAKLGRPVPITIGPKRVGDPPKLVANTQKATQILGWTPKYTLSDIIQSAINWHIHT
jgi:UDP-glucose 4-epimerase